MKDRVRLVGVPTDYGANRRGVDMGPSAIRYAGIADTIETVGYECEDGGDITVARTPHPLNEPAKKDRLKHFDEIRDVCLTLADRVENTVNEGIRPIILGGDHSIAIGSLLGTAKDTEIGLLWIDAHGDFNTPETTPSGNVHGMPLAAVLNQGSFAEIPWTSVPGLKPENVAMVGMRNIDAEERAAISDSPITAYTVSDIDRKGIRTIIEKAASTVTAGTDGVHLSLDLDVVDPDVAPGVGTPERGGLTYREAHAALETLADMTIPRSIDLVEVNPILDKHNQTAELACELVASALGERIL